MAGMSIAESLDVDEMLKGSVKGWMMLFRPTTCENSEA